MSIILSLTPNYGQSMAYIFAQAMIWSGGGTIVVAFRGSASMANLLTDLQVCTKLW